MKEYTVKVFEDGTKTWYLDGERHREDGPAVEFSSGTKAWYINGQKLTEEEHNRRTSGVTMDDALAAGYRRTYRGALYDVFGFDMGMYGQGMSCGYFNLHNMIFDSFELSAMKNVTRFEVIDDKGRTYDKYLKDDEVIKYSLQDDDRTLKVFIDNLSWKGE